MSTLPTQVFVKYNKDPEYAYGILYEIPRRSNNNIAKQVNFNLNNQKMIRLTLIELSKKCLPGLFGISDEKKLRKKLLNRNNSSKELPLYHTSIYTVLQPPLDFEEITPPDPELFKEYKYLLDALDECESRDLTEKAFQFLKGFDRVLYPVERNHFQDPHTIAYSNKVSQDILRLPLARFFYDKRSECRDIMQWNEYKEMYKNLGEAIIPPEILTTPSEPLVKIMYTRKRDASLVGVKLPAWASGALVQSQCVIELDDSVNQSRYHDPHLWIKYPHSDGHLQVQKVKSLKFNRQSEQPMKIPLNFYPEPATVGVNIFPRKIPNEVLSKETKERINHHFKCVIFGGELHCDKSQGGALCRVFMPSVQYDKTSPIVSSRGGKKGGKSAKKKSGKKVKKVRKHQGIYQTGNKKGRLKPGFKYSGKKTKTGLKIIIRVKKK